VDLLLCRLADEPSQQRRLFSIARRELLGVWCFFTQEMKQVVLPLLVCSFFLGFFQRSVDASTTDYAFMSATPYNSEIALARDRLAKFLYKADAKKRAILAQTPIVAVQAAVVQASESGSLLRRIGRQGDWGVTGPGPSPGDSRQLAFLLLFDSRTGQLVSNDGFLVLYTPQRGEIGVFGGVSALYIGAGW
jgi:hypothetical protein